MPRRSPKNRTAAYDTSRPAKERLVSRVKQEPPVFASPDDVDEYIEQAPWEYLECRVGLRHSWDHHGGRRNDDGTVTRTILCERCGAERQIVYNRNGRPQGSKYDHPEGYVNAGRGRFDTEGMDRMRSAILTHLIDEE